MPQGAFCQPLCQRCRGQPSFGVSVVWFHGFRVSGATGFKWLRGPRVANRFRGFECRAEGSLVLRAARSTDGFISQYLL